MFLFENCQYVTNSLETISLQSHHWHPIGLCTEDLSRAPSELCNCEVQLPFVTALSWFPAISQFDAGAGHQPAILLPLFCWSIWTFFLFFSILKVNIQIAVTLKSIFFCQSNIVLLLTSLTTFRFFLCLPQVLFNGEQQIYVVNWPEK